MTVPVGQAGGGTVSAGPWATYIMSLPWKVARSARFIKTEAIKVMKGATTVRDPLQRSSTRYTSKRMDEKIRSSAANVESAMIQIVGEVSQQECNSCQKRNGPWAQCIRFQDIDRTVSSCGNCHWNGQQRRCSYYQAPVSQASTPTHRRHRSSTDSLQLRDEQIAEEANARMRATGELRQVVRGLQAEMNIDAVQNAAIHRAMQAENFANRFYHWLISLASIILIVGPSKINIFTVVARLWFLPIVLSVM